MTISGFFRESVARTRKSPGSLSKPLKDAKQNFTNLLMKFLHEFPFHVRNVVPWTKAMIIHLIF